MPNGDLLIAGTRSNCILRAEKATGKVSVHADLRRFRTGACAKNYLNDMVVNANGDLYVGLDGVAALGGGSPSMARVILVKADGKASVAVDDFPGFPNGVVITPDGKTLILADSNNACLLGFDIAADGSLSNRRVWADLKGSAPDGICLDAENCVWVANPGTGRKALDANPNLPKHFAREKRNPYSCFIRVAEGGEVKDVIENQSQKAIACALGEDASGQGVLYMVECSEARNQPPADTSLGRIASIKVKVGPAKRPGDARYACGYC